MTSTDAAPAIPDAGVVALAVAKPPDAGRAPIDAARRHVVTPVVVAVATSAPAPMMIVAPDAAPPPPDLRPATIQIKVKPWCDIMIDGKPYGRSPADLTIEPGKHDLVCGQQSVGGPSIHVPLDVTPGSTTEIARDLFPSIRITVDLANATIDGTPHARGEVVELKPGNHKVGAKRLDLSHDCVLRDSPELACY
jgi:hypothetical protein